MKQKTGRKFWISLILFGLIGQVAWVVENMYLNVFIYKMFHASAAQISFMVGASAVTAAVTTLLVGAWSDKVGKRKIFICLGYALWGMTIFGFGLVRMDILTPVAGSMAAAGSMATAASMGVTIVILLDCVMTFFGSGANDACYNAWLTDCGDETNRGKIEGINSMMPLLAILVVFGGFMGFDLERADNWSMIYTIIGAVVLVTGLLGLFLIKEPDTKKESHSFWETLRYSFRPSVVRENKLLYSVLGAFALFGISIQVFMPYLILYYEQSLGMKNYVMIMAPAILLAAVITALYGKVYDMLGFRTSVIPCLVMLMSGYVVLFFSKTTLPVFIGSLLMMSGYLTGMAVFGAMIRDHIPEHKAGQFQGVRIIGQVLIPGSIGPAIGAFVLRNAAKIENSDGTYSFLPNRSIWAAAFVTAVVLCVVLCLIFYLMRMGHYELWTQAGEELMNQYRGMKADGGAVGTEAEQKKADKEHIGKNQDGACEGKIWQEYPRPQMKRESFLSLNGEWHLNRHTVLVPFPPQSLLSGYDRHVGERLTYEKAFTVPDSFFGNRILLHFGAVDQIAEVWLNGIYIGRHEGGYLPFTYDVTEHIEKENLLLVKVTDTLSERYPYGKQRKKRGGMWYTPVSGIWQSVWLEPVPEQYISGLTITPDLSGIDITVELAGETAASMTPESAEQNATAPVTVEILLDNGEWIKKSLEGNSGRIDLTEHICADGTAYQPKLWSPEHPYLYEMRIMTAQDVVMSYFALRTIEVQKLHDVNRVCLNGKPIFLNGVLDQGYYSDGIYLPAEEAEYERDILRMKELGYNMLRKHIKVEPEYFYYACDKHGMLVMQDMVNSGHYSFLKDTALPTIGVRSRNDRKGNSASRRKNFFRQHVKDTIRQLYNHPCLIAYTIFNEGWGQFESDLMYDTVKETDATRLIDATSGWFAQQKSDFDSEHIYFKLMKLNPDKRPMLVSECGGYSYLVDGHFYAKYNHYGYGNCTDSAQLTQTIAHMYRKMLLPAIKGGVCGCIYTQLSDVEDETNGLYTYDRCVCKVDREAMRETAAALEAELREVTGMQ